MATGFGSALLLLAIHGQAASLIGLGQLSDNGWPSSAANAVSADGKVVVGKSNSDNEAFVWTPSGGMVGLGVLAEGFPRLSEANGVTTDGLTVVGSSINSENDRQAFVWTRAEGMVGLADPGKVDGRALGISGDGSVVVGRFFSAYGFQAFRWTKATGVVGLGDFPGGGYESAARGASNDGSVIAGYGRSTNGYEASIWTEAGGMEGLGDLPGGIFDSSASAISGDGKVIVGGSESGNGFEAFRWTKAGGMAGLGDLQGGAFSSIAYGVSSNGAVVVGHGESESGKEAFVWTSSGGMRRLWDVLAGQGVDPSADGWSILTQASSVSSDGRYVVGFGTRDDHTEAFLADLGPVPDPAPELGIPAYSAGAIRIALTGVAGLRYVIESSTNILTWFPAETNTAPFVHTNAVPAPQHTKFFRGVYVP